MKKKLLLIFGMLLFSFALIFFAKDIQKQAADKLLQHNPQIQSSQIDKSGESSEGSSLNVNEEDPPSQVINPPHLQQENQQSKAETQQPLDKTVPDKPKEPEEAKPVNPNLIILDATSDKTLLSLTLSYEGKRSLQEYMKEALKSAGLDYYIKPDGYVASIAGLSDYPSMKDKAGKSDWSACGWIYYINGVKAVSGSKDYAPKQEDIIVWKYWKNALEEK